MSVRPGAWDPQGGNAATVLNYLVSFHIDLDKTTIPEITRTTQKIDGSPTSYTAWTSLTLRDPSPENTVPSLFEDDDSVLTHLLGLQGLANMRKYSVPVLWDGNHMGLPDGFGCNLQIWYDSTMLSSTITNVYQTVTLSRRDVTTGQHLLVHPVDSAGQAGGGKPSDKPRPGKGDCRLWSVPFVSKYQKKDVEPVSITLHLHLHLHKAFLALNIQESAPVGAASAQS